MNQLKVLNNVVVREDIPKEKNIEKNEDFKKSIKDISEESEDFKVSESDIEKVCEKIEEKEPKDTVLEELENLEEILLILNSLDIKSIEKNDLKILEKIDVKINESLDNLKSLNIFNVEITHKEVEKILDIPIVENLEHLDYKTIENLKNIISIPLVVDTENLEVKNFKKEIKGKETKDFTKTITKEEVKLLEEKVDKIKNLDIKKPFIEEKILHKDIFFKGENIEEKVDLDIDIEGKKPKIQEFKKIDLEDDDSKLNKFIKSEDTGDIINSFKGRIKTINVSKPEKVERVVSKDTISRDIIKNIKYSERLNFKELTLKVYPRELGEISIKVTLEDGNMKATIKSNNKEAFSMLSNNADEIKKLIKDDTIKISEVSISLYEDDTTYFSGESRGEREFKENNKNKFKFIEEEDDNLNDNVKPLENLVINILA